MKRVEMIEWEEAMFTSTKLIHIDTEAINHMIYPLAGFENMKLSYEEFKQALMGEYEDSWDQEDILFAKNLETASMYMLDTLDEEVSVEYAYRINELLTNGRIKNGLKRDFEITEEDLEYIKILRECDYDLSNYDLTKIVPSIPAMGELDEYMNISRQTYQNIVNEVITQKYEGFAYQCFMPMICKQYFKKSNIITGALIVCKIVLQAKEHLMFIEESHRIDLAKVLLDCIYYKDDSRFQHFIDIMVKHRVEMESKSSVKVMIHYD